MHHEITPSSPRPSSLGAWLEREREETARLLRCVPAVTVSLFAASVICMNLLANKTLVQRDWIALDGGILISWMSFLCMDIITKHFGPKASNRIAVLAVGINLFVCLVFRAASLIPSDAADYTALDTIFGGTWFILLGSTIAFLASAFLNNFLNWGIGQALWKNPDGKLAFAVRTYLSTFLGQFADNLIFSVIVFLGFAPIFWDGFCWTLPQCVVCALTGAIAELAAEILFSPLAYRILCQWKKNHVGQEYLTYVNKES